MGTVAKDKRFHKLVAGILASVILITMAMCGGMAGMVGGGEGEEEQNGLAVSAAALRGAPIEASDIIRQAVAETSVPWPVVMALYVLFTPDHLTAVEDTDLSSGISPTDSEDGVYRMGVDEVKAAEAGVNPDDLYATSRWIARTLADVPPGDPRIDDVDILAGTMSVVEDSGRVTNKKQPAAVGDQISEREFEILSEDAKKARTAWTTALVRLDGLFTKSIDQNRANEIFDEAVSIAGGLEPSPSFGVCGAREVLGDTALTIGSEAPETLTGEQAAIAQLIYQAVSERGLPVEDLVIALMVAREESGMKNLDHGDRDSLGVFQQRPSQGWGTPAQIMDPVYATGKFLDALENPDLNLSYARTSILGGNQIFPNRAPDSRHNYDPWLIAQAVQGSAFVGRGNPFPGRPYGSEAGGNYKQHYRSAVAWATELFGSTPTAPAMCATLPGMMTTAYYVDSLIEKISTAEDVGFLGNTSALDAEKGKWLTLSQLGEILFGDEATPAQLNVLTKFLRDNDVESMQVNVEAGGPLVEATIAEAEKHIGKPYVWAASGPNSFDCSGFTSWSYNLALKAAGISIQLPHSAQAQYEWARKNGTLFEWGQRQRGDLIFWNLNSSDSRFIDHVGIYLGKDAQGQDIMINSQRPPGRVIEGHVFSPDRIVAVGRVVVGGGQ